MIDIINYDCHVYEFLHLCTGKKSSLKYCMQSKYNLIVYEKKCSVKSLNSFVPSLFQKHLPSICFNSSMATKEHNAFTLALENYKIYPEFSKICRL